MLRLTSIGGYNFDFNIIKENKKFKMSFGEEGKRKFDQRRKFCLKCKKNVFFCVGKIEQDEFLRPYFMNRLTLSNYTEKWWNIWRNI